MNIRRSGFGAATLGSMALGGLLAADLGVRDGLRAWMRHATRSTPATSQGDG
jgi:hypothetical protein